jgi:hypothetical protein
LPTEQEIALARHEQYMLERSERDRDQARRWSALARVLVDGSR